MADYVVDYCFLGKKYFISNYCIGVNMIKNLKFMIVFCCLVFDGMGLNASTLAPLLTFTSQVIIFQNQVKDDLNTGIELARKAKTAGDLKLAAYIYLNLINKSPDQIAILNEYASFISKQDKITVQELDELSNLIMISVFKVPVGEVKNVLDLAKQIGDQKEKLSAKLDVPKDDEGKDVEIESEKLLKQVEIFPGDETKLKKLLDDLNENREVLNPNSAKLKFIEKAANEVSELYQTIQKIKFIEICLTKLNNEKKSNRLNSDLCVSLIQAAEATLPTLYGLTIEDSRIPTEIKNKINELPTQCKFLVNEISNARSLIVFEKIKELIAEGNLIDPWKKNAEGIHVYPKWQDCAIAIEKVLKKIQTKLVEINSSEVVEKAALDIKVLQEKLNEIRRSQYREYQLNALSRLSDAFNVYNSYKWTNLGDAKAFTVLKDNRIYQIDLALISPDVSRCYNDIVSKLLAQMFPTSLPDWYKLCSTEVKWRLEDF